MIHSLTNPDKKKPAMAGHSFTGSRKRTFRLSRVLLRDPRLWWGLILVGVIAVGVMLSFVLHYRGKTRRRLFSLSVCYVLGGDVF